MDGNRGEELVRRSTELGTSSTQMLRDLDAALFPKSDVLITDRMISNGRQYLRSIIGQIESEICRISVRENGLNHETIIAIGNDPQSRTYQMLSKANLLNGNSLMEFLLAHIQRSELTNNLLQKVSREDIEAVLSVHLDHSDAAIAEAAMALLVAQSKSNAGDANIADFPADLLHNLSWSIAAAIEKLSGYTGSAVSDATQRFLAKYDEGASSNNRALRLAQLLGKSNEDDDGVPHPFHDGLLLFLAKLSQRSGLTSDQISIFSADPDMARLVILLRALDIPVQDALSIFAALDGKGQILSAASYNEVGAEQARVLVDQWNRSATYRNAAQALLGADSGDLD